MHGEHFTETIVLGNVATHLARKIVSEPLDPSDPDRLGCVVASTLRRKTRDPLDPLETARQESRLADQVPRRIEKANQVHEVKRALFERYLKKNLFMPFGHMKSKI